jgi:hypothetical protein
MPETPRDTYIVEAKRWELGFELHITGRGVEGMSQTSFIEDALSMARDYIATELDIMPNSFDVELRPANVPIDDEQFHAGLAQQFKQSREMLKKQIRREFEQEWRDILLSLAYQAYGFWMGKSAGGTDWDISTDETRGALNAHLITAALFELAPDYPDGVPEEAVGAKIPELLDRIKATYIREPR